MTLLALLGLFALVAVPGLGAVLALLRPGRVGLATKLALVFTLGYAVSGGVGYLLTVARVLSPATFLTALALVTGGLWFLAARRGLREQWRAAADEVKTDPWPLLLGIAVVVVIAAVWLGYLSTFRTISPYRYWVDGMELADAGRVPAATLHYGRLYPPVTSKIFLNAFTAGADYVTAGHVPEAINAMLWLTAAGTALSLWAVGRELGLGVLAPLLPVLLIANRAVLGRDMSLDLSSYRAEIVGRMVAFGALALAVHGLRRGGLRREVWVAGLLFAAAAGTHLVPTVVCAAFLAGYVAARLLIDRDRAALLKRGAALAAIVAVAGALVLLLPRGEIGFEGAGRPEAYTRVDFDKTRYLYNGSMAPADRAGRGPFYVQPGAVVHDYVSRALGVDARSPAAGGAWSLVLVTGGIAIALVMLRWFRGDLRVVGLAALGLAGTLVAVSLFFSYRYDLFVPATFGVRRLFDYASLPVALGSLGLLEGGLARLGRYRAAAPLAVGVALVIATSAVLVPTVRIGGVRGRKAFEVLSWVRRNTPCDARILVNQRTVGVLRAMTGRVGVLEGMGPFLRPRMLDEVVDLLLRARSFFAAPEANARFVADEGVDYVVAISGFRLGHVPEVGAPNLPALRDVSFLRPVYSSPQAEIYRVAEVEPSRAFPDPADHPGYRCRRDAIGR